MSDTLIITNSNTKLLGNNTYSLQLPVPIEFVDKEIGLVSLQMFNSWFNITASFANNAIVFYQGANTLNLIIPDGFYSIKSLNEYFQLQMFNAGWYLLDKDKNPVYPITFTANSVYYSITMSFLIYSTLPTGWTNPSGIINFSQPVYAMFKNPFGKIIGFTSPNDGNITYPLTAITQSTSYNSNSIPIVNPTTAINLLCSLVNTSQFTTGYSSSIYTFNTYSNAFGDLISIYPPSIVFLPINNGRYSQINFSFVSQDGFSPLNILDHSGTVMKLVIRDKQ